MPARWDLAPRDRYMWASVQTVRGCPKHCSFCSVWRTDGQKPRQRASDVVIEEIVQLRRLGFRFIALADDNFYPVTLTDIQLAEKQGNAHRVGELQAMRSERFELMEKLAKLPADMVFFTQITMEAGEDTQFLDAMRKARIKGALVGVESVTAEGLKSVFKEFNSAGADLATRLSTFKEHGVHVLGSFIFGLPSDRKDTFAATAALAKAGGPDLRAVRDDDSLSRHRGLRSMGEEHERQRSSRGRSSDHPLLADSRQRAAEDVQSARDDDDGGDPRADAGGLGQLLQPAGDLGAGRSACPRCAAGWRSCSSPSCIARCTRTRAFRRTAPGGRRRRGWRAGWPCRAESYSKRSRCRSSKCRPCGGLRG